MKIIPLSFFEGDSFLDIGSNKGFFSLFAKKTCRYVEAIDNVPEYVVLCKNLGINTTYASFRQYNPSQKFDRIMIGNVMHYMYRECGGWEFIIKLAAISNGLVLIEAPTGMECNDMKGVFPKELEKNFNHSLFMEKMGEFFNVVLIANSPSPDRYIMLFERKQVAQYHLDKNDLSDWKILKKGDESVVYRLKNYVIKIITKPHTVKDEIQIFIASHSPISNGFKEMIYDQNGFAGWTEEYSEQRILRYFKKQDEVWQQVCRHNVFLAKLGYTDIDVATINFFIDFTLFDKGGIRHVEDMSEDLIKNLETGFYFSMLRNSYNIPINLKKIHKTLNTRDSFKIQKMYEDMIVFKSTKISLGLGRFFKR